jgi:hypothetical protein
VCLEVVLASNSLSPMSLLLGSLPFVIAKTLASSMRAAPPEAGDGQGRLEDMVRPVGANPKPAATKGQYVVDLASQYRMVASNFRGAFGTAENCAGEPEVVRGFQKLGPHLVGAVDALQRVATSLGLNVTAAAGAVARTDHANTDGFDSTRDDLHRPGWRR